MQEVFEKIVEKLDEKAKLHMDSSKRVGISREYRIEQLDLYGCCINAIEIVKNEAEQYNNGWIPCSERMPEEAFGCFVTVMDYNQTTETEFENILPYFVGYDGHSWNDADGNTIPFEVIAWQPRPEPYQPEEI